MDLQKAAFPASALIIALAVSYLFLQSRTPDYDRYSEIIQATYRIEALDATFNRDMLLIRAGLLKHYDSVNHSIIEMRKEISSVSTNIELFHKDKEHHNIKSQLQLISDTIEKKEQLLDQFISNNAILQNSYNFVLSMHGKLINKIIDDPTKHKILPELLRLTSIFPRFVQGPTPTLQDYLLSYIDIINSFDQDRDLIDSIILHTKSILQRAAPIHGIILTSLELPVNKLLYDLRFLLSRTHAQSQFYANTNRNLLYGSAILLLFFLSYLFFRLQRNSSAVTAANLALTKEVKERQQIEEALSLEKNRLRTVLNNLPTLLWAIDKQGIFLLSEGKSLRSIGLKPGELVGKSIFKVYSQNTAIIDRMMQALQGQTSNCTIQFDEIVFECSFTPIINKSQAIIGAIGTAIDITERYQAETQLQLAAKVFENTTEGIAVMDGGKNIITVNRAFCEMSGYSSTELIGHNFLSLNSTAHDPGFYDALWNEVDIHKQWKGEVWAHRKDGKTYPQLFNIRALATEDNKVTHYIVITSDITRLIETQRRLEHLASYDLLTDLPNRSFFYNRLNHCHAKAQRAKLSFAIMFVDIDDFKKINDNLGHEVGDELLKTVAERLKKCVREQDTIARMGGDEFTLLLEQITGTNEVAVTAQRLVQEMSTPFYIGNHEIFITISVGICLYPTDGTNIPSLIKNADTAMYKAKEQGKNAFMFFTESMNKAMYNRFSIESQLRRALDKGELFLCYQPQLNLNTNSITGIEALIRWQHPEKGVLCPDFFLPIAEETGLISAIGEWVLETAFRQIKIWNDAGLTTCRISVNVSARQFIYKDLVGTISRILDDTDVSAGLIALDIKESTVMHNPDYTQKVLTNLNALGIDVSIDDFGTGYSSLSYLRHFPLSKLKIDQSFIRNITRSADDAAIAAAIISMAHNLNMTVGAEGVETGEQLDFLKTHRCDFAQGYYVSKPLAADIMTEFLRYDKPAPALPH